MPNLYPWINQNEEHIAINKFENHLLSIKAEHQKRIRPNLHPSYNERHQKIIELINCTLDAYKTAIINITNNQQNEEEQVIIDNIIKELDKKKRISYKQKAKNFAKR